MAANCLTDLKKLYSLYFAANQDGASGVVFMSQGNAAAAASATAMPTFGANGGESWGCRVETSAALGSRVIMFEPQALAVADAGTIMITASGQATVELDTIYLRYVDEVFSFFEVSRGGTAARTIARACEGLDLRQSAQRRG